MDKTESTPANANGNFAFTLFMYASQPWTESRVAEGGVVTDGKRVITFLKEKLADPDLVGHFATCADCAAQESVNSRSTNPIEVLEKTIAQAIDKGTAISFSRVKTISATDFDKAIACIRDCFLPGEKAAAIV